MLSSSTSVLDGKVDVAPAAIQNIKEYDYQKLLASEIPEEVLFAVLGNFNRASADQVIRQILNRLQAIATEEIKGLESIPLVAL